MYVYLRYGTLIKRFLDVDLIDCVQPQVDGVSVPGTDPTVWFKVLILDSILVDCDGREVYWNKEPVVEATTIHWTKEKDLTVDDVLPFYQTQGKMFEGGCIDFDVDIDELFESARGIVEELEHSAVDFLDDKELLQLKQKVFRVIHMFILPKLTLRKSEIKDLHEVEALTEQFQKDLEINIVTKEKIKYRTGRFLEKQRLSMLTNQDLSSERLVSTFNYDFLKHFLKHLETDISVGNESMLAFEKEISPLRTCQTLKEQDMLNHWRDKRDKTWSHINKAVVARETIKNVIVRPNFDKNRGISMETSIHPDHIVYQETSCRLQSITDEVNGLKETMLKLSSVKEATTQTIREIEETGESCGKFKNVSDFVRNIKAETDEWSTLSGRVDSLLSAKPLGFKDKHKKFCEMIESRIKKLPDSSKVRMSLGLESKERASKRQSKLVPSSVPLYGLPVEEVTTVEEICVEVIKHTMEMAYILAEEIFKRPRSEIPQSDYENIYICYESYVSSELLPVLYDLFEKCYKMQCEALTSCFSNMVLSETLMANIRPAKETTAHAKDESTKDSKNAVLQELHKMFDSLVRNETDEKMSVFTKLRQILDIVQFIVKKAKQMGFKANPNCTDEILDIMIPILQKLDPELFMKLYAHTVMLTHLRPSFVEGSRLHFAFVSFSAAYQHLFNEHKSVLSKISK